MPNPAEIERRFLDRVTPWLPLVSIAVGALLVLAVIGTGYAAQTAANNSDQVRRGNELSACRSDAYGRVAWTAQQLDQARADLDVLVATGLDAALTDDDAEMQSVLDRIDTATAEVQARAVEAREAAVAYVEATQLAATDPDRFLDQCRTPDPPEGTP